MKLKTLLIIPVLLASNASLADDNGFHLTVSDKIPDGFENIAGDDNYYDVVINGKYYKTFDINNQSRLSDTRISKLFNFDVIDLKNTKDGVLVDNEFISILFYRKEKRIDIFEKRKVKNDFVKSGFSFGSSLSGAMSSSYNSSSRKSLRSNTKLSYNEHSARVNTSWVGDKLNIDDIYYSTEVNDDRVNVGYFRPQDNLGLIGSGKIYGASYVFNAKLSEMGSKRNDLNLLLRSPANVAISRGDELIETLSLEQGNNTLVTDKYPGGYYNVKVEIFYLDGSVETRTLSLSSAGLDRKKNWSIKSITAGVKENQNKTSIYGGYGLFTGNDIEDEERDEYTPYLASELAGYSYDKGSTSFGFTYYDDELTFSPEIHLADEFVRFDSSANIGSSKWGLSSRLSVDVNGHSVNLDYSRSKFNDLASIRGGFSATYSYVTEEYGSFYSTMYKSTETKNTSYQFFHTYNWYLNGNQKIGLATSVLYGDEVTFGFELSFSARKKDFRYMGSVAYNDDISYRQSLFYNDRYDGGSYSGQVSDSRNGDFTNRYVQASVSDNKYGMGSLQVGQVDNAGSYVNSSFYTSFSGNEDDFYPVGVSSYSQGVLINLDDAPEGDYLLRLNGQMKKMSSGSNYYQELKPHAKYTVELINETNPNAIVESGEKSFYLHRDNLYTPKWDIYKTKLFFGRLLIDGEPVKNKLVKTEVSEAFTDDNGYLAVQVKESEIALKVNGVTCYLVSPKNSINSGDIQCLK